MDNILYEDDLVLEDTENVGEQTTEETVEGETTADTEQVEEKLYTEAELNARVDEILGKKIARKEAKIRKEYEKKLEPYRRAETVLNAGLGTSDIGEATKSLTDFYAEKGVVIPEYDDSQYSEDDLKILANNEAQNIINLGYEEVVEEVDRLADIGLDNMSARERLVFGELAKYRQAEGSRQELKSIGVRDDVIESEDFKSFASKFNQNTSITEIYELYAKTGDKPPTAKIGSMKNGNTQEEKTYYTPEEVDRLTEKDLEDPKIFAAVRASMEKWK
ncbi:MAG: hypothetical protein ACI4LK_02365 [Lentihominibacter sp.]